MKDELDQKLVNKYPEIFRNRYGDMRETAMCWGFECGDGWYDLIDNACAVMDNVIKNQHRHVKWNIDWLAIHDAAIAGNWEPYDTEFNRLHPEKYSEHWTKEKRDALYIKNKEYYLRTDLAEEKRQDVTPREWPVAVQVKEKFGTLRFYVDNTCERMDGAIEMAEYMSGCICEECGNPGKQRGGGWIRTLCDKHAEEMGYYIDDEDELTEEKSPGYLPFGQPSS